MHQPAFLEESVTGRYVCAVKRFDPVLGKWVTDLRTFNRHLMYKGLNVITVKLDSGKR